MVSPPAHCDIRVRRWTMAGRGRPVTPECRYAQRLGLGQGREEVRYPRGRGLDRI